jgi:hypothetical protein
LRAEEGARLLGRRSIGPVRPARNTVPECFGAFAHCPFARSQRAEEGARGPIWGVEKLEVTGPRITLKTMRPLRFDRRSRRELGARAQLLLPRGEDRCGPLLTRKLPSIEPCISRASRQTSAGVPAASDRCARGSPA